MLAGAVLSMPALAQAQPAPTAGNLAGVWTVAVTSPQGETPVTLALTDDNGRLAGVLSSPRGNVPVEGTRTADAVTLRFSVNHEGAPLPVALTAPAGADALSGTADFGGQASGTWKASRTTPKGVEGVWLFTAVHNDGTESKGTLTLLESNGSVNGRLIIRERNVDGVARGALKDGALALTVDATVDGSPITIDLPGEVAAEKLSGTFAVADISGRWSATRQ